MLGSARSGVGGEKKKKKNKQRLLVYLKCIRVMHGGLPNNNNERKTACQHLKAIGQFCINSTVLSWEGKGLIPLEWSYLLDKEILSFPLCVIRH